jgi:hypothetical protein
MWIWLITRVTRWMWLLKQESLHEEWQTIQWPNETTTKRQTRIYKTLHTKQKIEQHSTKNIRWTQVPRKGEPFLHHMWHPSCYSLATRESFYVEIVLDTGMHKNKWNACFSRSGINQMWILQTYKTCWRH